MVCIWIRSSICLRFNPFVYFISGGIKRKNLKKVGPEYSGPTFFKFFLLIPDPMYIYKTTAPLANASVIPAT